MQAKRIFQLIAAMMLVGVTSFASCKQNIKEQDKVMNDKKKLVVYFSRTGENYAVGNIKKGNTHIIADMIAEEAGCDTFQIVPATPYPNDYTECTEVAKKEADSNARPATKGDTNVEDYDIIFIGYPNWWGNAPMPVYTFIEKHDWHGKIVIPFCTHEGSGLGSTADNVKAACKGATMLEGLAVRGATAQNEQAKARKAVKAWLSKLNF